jgi:hypothetical protein
MNAIIPVTKYIILGNMSNITEMKRVKLGTKTASQISLLN